MDPIKILIRALSGAIYVAIMVCALLWGAGATIFLAVILAVIASLECSLMFGNPQKRNDVRSIVIALTDALGCMILAFGPSRTGLMLWVMVMIARFIMSIGSEDQALTSLSRSLMQQIWIGVPMCAMSYIAVYWSPMILLLALILVWTNDTGAYLVGSLTGRHSLCPRLSPKKTWEGFVGGMVLSTAVATVLGLTCPDTWQLHEPWWVYLLMGIGVTLFATWGDLLESMVKRSIHVKDSGNLIPGHGGLLDRIDSLLMVVPALMLFLYFLQF